MSIPSFLFGGDTNVSYSELQQRRKVLDAMMARQAGQAPQNIGEGLNALGQGILNGIEGRQLRNAQEKSDAAAKLDYSTALGAFSAPYTTASPTAPGAGQSYTPAASAAPMPGATTGGASVASDLPGGEIYSSFIDTVRSGDPTKNLPGITNPYGLAAVAATGKRESGFSPGNVYRQWSDPSQSGQPGNAGGILSWRAERLDRMRSFVAQNGGDPNRPSPQLQAQFFLAEDPSLVQQLNSAKSPEEAQTLMNNAWRFAGYDDPNNAERNARIATARSYAGQFEGQQTPQQPVQVASLDASVGMAPQEAAGGRGAVAAAMPPPTAPTPSPTVQRVAQAMPQPPNLQVDPRIAQALQNPALPEGQRRVLGAMLEQQQAQAQARYEADLRTWQTQDERAYQAGVRAEDRGYDAVVRQEGRAADAVIRQDNNAREDSRNQYLDARQGSRDARADLTSDRDYDLRVQQANEPKIIDIYDEETGRSRKGYLDQNGTFVPVGGVEAPKKGNGVTVRGPDGSLIQVGGDAPALTEGQSKDAVYSTRARGALETLDKYAPALMGRVDRIRDVVPFGLGREGQNTDYQLARQSGNEFLQAILRKDTGAAITGEEESLYGVTYLPQPGDSDALLAQKQQSRARAIAAIEAGMPPAAMVAQEIALRKSSQPRTIQPVTASPGATAPAVQIPQGIDPEDWDLLTDEERRLWQ